MSKRRGIAIVDALGSEDAADQAESVRVRAGGGEAEQHVALGAVKARQQADALDHAGGVAGEVVVAILEHAWHFRRAAAAQHCTGLAAALGDAGQDALSRLRIGCAASVVEVKRQRLRPVSKQQVASVVDQVNADGLVQPSCHRHFELAARGAIGADQDRVLVASRSRIE
jgi:hypothetical protein